MKIIKWLEKYYTIPLIIAIIIAGIIFYLSSKPASFYPSLGILTKIYHVTIYFLFTLFLLLAIVRGKSKNKYFVFIAILIAVLYATTDEIHQAFVPGRDPAFTDVMIDSIGIMIAGIIYSIRLKFRK